MKSDKMLVMAEAMQVSPKRFPRLVGSMLWAETGIFSVVMMYLPNPHVPLFWGVHTPELLLRGLLLSSTIFLGLLLAIESCVDRTFSKFHHLTHSPTVVLELTDHLFVFANSKKVCSFSAGHDRLLSCKTSQWIGIKQDFAPFPTPFLSFP